MDKCVENVGINSEISNQTVGTEDIHTLIFGFSTSFPPIFDEKKYKLINFAPKTEIVDNCQSSPRLSKLASTVGVDNSKPRVDKLSGKKKG